MKLSRLVTLSLLVIPIFAHADVPSVQSIHEKLSQCMVRLAQSMGENRSQIERDHDQSSMESQEIESVVKRRFFVLNWAEKIYDHYAQGSWDWERPKTEKTQTGKIRAFGERSQKMEEKLSRLREMFVMRSKGSDQLEYLFSKLVAKRAIGEPDWTEVRTSLRNLEQEYYDFMNDELRQKVHEKGMADEVNWNKTMGSLQETFYRNTSCVTLMDQMHFLIPPSLLLEGGPRLASHLTALSSF